MSRSTTTRSLLAVAVAILLVMACRRAERCATCGMKIDPASPWVSYVTIDGKEQAFDTPSCAFAGWRKAGTTGTNARFREYYSQEMKSAEELRFVRGSDVIGPMGPDLVPVSEGAARRFARDHNGAPPQSANELVRGETP
jgi:nitrous oxide reductase accessory protein NosL